MNMLSNASTYRVQYNTVLLRSQVQQSPEAPGELPDGPAAVADAVLLLGGQLGDGASQLRKVEDRIVPEAVFPAWSPRDQALHDAVSLDENTPRIGKGQVAQKPGGSLRVLHAAEFLQQFGVARPVQRAPVRAQLTAIGGVTGAEHAGPACQGVHRQAGIVRQGPLPGRAGVVQRLGAGVLGERGARLLRFVNVPKFVDGAYRDGKIRYRAANLSGFSGISRR